MSRLLFSGGTVVTASGSYRADALVADEKIAAVGTELDADAAGRLVMSVFIDAHTHLDMPFGGTVTAGDWTLGLREGKLSENQFVAALSTNQARIYGAYPRKGDLAPGAVLWCPGLKTTVTVENRHSKVDYTSYEGMELHGGPAAVYVRGSLVYRDGEVVGERGSGRFVERSFTAPNLEVGV